MPVLGNGGKTYVLRLRPGLKYSDGTPVKASDFKRAIQRVLNLESGGAFLYEGIVGATAYEKAGKASGPLPGIKADDATGTVPVELVAPDPQFNFKLAMDFAGLVPGNTPFSNETKSPPPGAGPFSIEQVVPGQSWSLVRNKYFKPLPNVPAAKADRINFTIVSNQRRQATDLVANKVDFLYNPAA